MTIRVLAVTARERYPKTWVTNLRRRLDLDGEAELRILVARRPRRSFDAEIIAIEDEPAPAAAEPTRRRLLGRRRGEPVAARPAPDPTAPLPEQLAHACRTNATPAELAAWADVVVATDDAGCLGVWELARRVPDAIYVNRMARVRPALEARGVALPPPTVTTVEAETGIAAQDARMSAVEPAGTRLLIAPANYAGQAYEWARAVDRHVPDAVAQNFKDRRLKHPYASDLVVDRLRFRADLDWRRHWREHVESTYTHVIVEAGLPVLGESAMPFERQVARLRAAGVQVALLSHGSDARIPSVHAANERWAQYEAMDPDWVRTLEAISRRNVAVYTSDPGPVFLSTPGLLEFVPNGTWLPLVVDVGRWHSDEPVLERARPVVAHAPSSKQKGSHHIDPVLSELDEQGLIEYRRVEGVPVDEMPGVYGTADIVVDQFGAADYGVAACEALAAGRVVVSHVAPGVRRHIRAETGLDLAIVQADPATLRDVIVRLVEDRDEGRAAAVAGRAFVETVHDGRLAAEVLSHWFARTSQSPVPRSGPDHHTK